MTDKINALNKRIKKYAATPVISTILAGAACIGNIFYQRSRFEEATQVPQGYEEYRIAQDTLSNLDKYIASNPQTYFASAREIIQSDIESMAEQNPSYATYSQEYKEAYDRFNRNSNIGVILFVGSIFASVTPVVLLINKRDRLAYAESIDRLSGTMEESQ